MSNKRWYKARPVVSKVLSSKTNLTYDSKLEATLHEGELAEFSFHPNKVAYTVNHTYSPDFSYSLEDSTILIETKGFFQDSAEAAKYKWIREALPPNYELVFIFEKPNTALPWSKPRKDKTRMTHQEWAVRNKFRAYSPEVTKEEILNGRQSKEV